MAPTFILFLLSHDPVTNEVNTTVSVIAGCIPMAGLVALVAFGPRASSLRALLPLVPFALAAAGFMTAQIVIAVADDQGGALEGTTDWYPNAVLVCLVTLVTQPFRHPGHPEETVRPCRTSAAA